MEKRVRKRGRLDDECGWRVAGGVHLLQFIHRVATAGGKGRSVSQEGKWRKKMVVGQWLIFFWRFVFLRGILGVSYFIYIYRYKKNTSLPSILTACERHLKPHFHLLFYFYIHFHSHFHQNLFHPTKRPTILDIFIPLSFYLNMFDFTLMVF